MIEDVWALLLKGGWVLVPIFIISLVGWFYIIERFWYLRVSSKAIDVSLHLKLQGLAGQSGITEQTYRHQVKEFLQHEFFELNRHLSTITVIASIAPLLGLLGTITGMVRTFKIITMYGTGNPAMLAQGISEALLTTQAGLMVAFPLVLCYNALQNKIESIENKSLSIATSWINQTLRRNANG